MQRLNKANCNINDDDLKELIKSSIQETPQKNAASFKVLNLGHNLITQRGIKAILRVKWGVDVKLVTLIQQDRKQRLQISFKDILAKINSFKCNNLIGEGGILHLSKAQWGLISLDLGKLESKGMGLGWLRMAHFPKIKFFTLYQEAFHMHQVCKLLLLEWERVYLVLISYQSMKEEIQRA